MALLFSTKDVSRQCFYRSSTAFGVVNLKPILPGHVLVIPRRVVPRLADLKPDEVSGLFQSVQVIGGIIEKAYYAQSLTIACQVEQFYLNETMHANVTIDNYRTEERQVNRSRMFMYTSFLEGIKVINSRMRTMISILPLRRRNESCQRHRLCR